MISYDPMRSWALFNLTDDERLKPIIHKPPLRNNRAHQPRTVLVEPTVKDVEAFQKMQEVLSPLTTDGSYPTWAGVIRAMLKVALLIEEADPGAMVRLLEDEKPLPKFNSVWLPNPDAVTAIETENEVWAKSVGADE